MRAALAAVAVVLGVACALASIATAATEVSPADGPPARAARPRVVRSQVPRAAPPPAPPLPLRVRAVPHVEPPQPEPATVEPSCLDVGRDDWFCRVRNADGSWGREQGSPGDALTTGLVLLCFLGAGETHESGIYKAEIRDAMKWLRTRQQPDGSFADTLRDHAVATLAWAESYVLTKSLLFRDRLERALARTAAWSEREPPDVETAAWLVLLWRSAAAADVQGAAGRLHSVADGLAACRASGDEELLRRAALALATLHLAPPADPDAHAAAAEAFAPVAGAFVAEPSALATMQPHRYLATLAAHRLGGDVWKRWSDRLQRLVLDTMRVAPDDPERGSWDPYAPGLAAHRVRATALSILELQTFYRYGRVIGSR